MAGRVGVAADVVIGEEVAQPVIIKVMINVKGNKVFLILSPLNLTQA